MPQLRRNVAHFLRVDRFCARSVRSEVSLILAEAVLALVNIIDVSVGGLAVS
jgi:hypothetical protein